MECRHHCVILHSDKPLVLHLLCCRRLLAEQALQHAAASLHLEDLQQLMQASEQELQELEADLQAEV